MQVLSFTFNPFQENTYILYDETGEAIIVDPGCHTASEEQLLFHTIEYKQLTPKAIVNTHCHIDHVFGINAVKEKYKIPFYCHEGELEQLNSMPEYAKLYGLSLAKIDPPEQALPEDSFQFGTTELEILYCPGHSPASICLVHKKEKQLIAGDVLFQGSIGRTDLPGGDYEQLMQSITTKILPLEDEYIVYSGHGNITTVGEERDSNPFILEYVKNN